LNLKKNLILEQIRLLIKENKYLKASITVICKEFNINRSSLYYQVRLDESQENKTLIELIKSIQSDNPCYGAKRIQLALKLNYDKVVNLKKIIRLRLKLDIVAVTRKRKNLARDRKLTDQSELVPNHYKTTLEEGKLIIKPNCIWVSDFTYLWLPQLSQFIYVATILDAFTREVLSFQTSFNHNTKLVLDTLKQAVIRYGIPQYYHSDQGSEYQAKEFQDKLKSLGISQSFAAKAKPWQNGRQESFYNNFKLELKYPSTYVINTTNNINYLFTDSLTEVEEKIKQQIFYYNHQRIHTTIKTYPHLKRLEYERSQILEKV
jgi:putative transposase